MKVVGSNQLLRVFVRDGLWRSESLPTAGMMLAQVDLVQQVRPTTTSWLCLQETEVLSVLLKGLS